MDRHTVPDANTLGWYSGGVKRHFGGSACGGVLVGAGVALGRAREEAAAADGARQPCGVGMTITMMSSSGVRRRRGAWGSARVEPSQQHVHAPDTSQGTT